MKQVVSVQTPKGLLVVTMTREINPAGVIVTRPVHATLNGKAINLAEARLLVEAEIRRRQEPSGGVKKR